MLIILHIIMICLAGLAFIATIFSEEGKINNLIESVLWGSLAACSVAYGATFAFVMGIIFAILLGFSVLDSIISEPKPVVLIHLPLCILFIVALCKFTY
jgi:hypothetical protein